MKINNNLLVGNLKEIIDSKNKRNNYTFTYNSNGNNYYTVDNKKLSIEEFNEMFPIEFKPQNKKGRNSDKTKSWMHGEKSY